MSLNIIHRAIGGIVCGLMAVTNSVFPKRKRKSIFNIDTDEEELIPEVASNETNLVKGISFKPTNSLIMSELKNLNWVHVGKVAKLHIYSLLSGKPCPADQCEITFDDMHLYKKGELINWSQSFVVYNKKTKCMVTTNNFPALREISLWLEDIYAILQATGMPTLRFVLKSRGFFHCIYSRCNEFQIYPKLICTDCGDEAAEWLCKFLYCKNSDLRLGYSLNRVNCIRTYWQPWIGDDMLCLGVMSDEHSLGPFISVLNSENTPQVPREDLSEALEIYDPLDMICPTIVIFAHNMYTDKIWKWIKIGDVIIKNSKSIIVQSSFKEEEVNKAIKFFGIGVNSIVYVPGFINLNDNVYVHFS
ncbi:mitochondrial amidoxime-reducing component 1-like [Harpegnathos saltator]|uniref:mitochondrial amidoxime-reducing component 1-like n=1 Tax=Harpegnathos saltator TaxID=610380 RepID=UPI00058C5938|nr:mitochondrial amidoxime-reducing component 1-like [Harpegnathos saltator]